MSSLPAERPVPLARPSRREEITRAAAQFFAESGYHTAGMRDIAEAVGIKGASLYNHFASKEEILFEVTLTVTRDLVEQHLQVLELPGRPSERLAALVRAHLLHLADHHVEHVVGTRELSALTPEHFGQQHEYRRYYQRRVIDVVKAGMRAGELAPDADARRCAVALLDLLNGISFWYRDSLDVEVVVRDYVELGVRGLLRCSLPLDDLVGFAESAWPTKP